MTDKVVKVAEHALQGITLPPLTRPPVPFLTPNEDLAIFAVRVYAYSLIAHIRTVLAGVIVLDEAGNTPSARPLCRHVFEWTAQAAYVAENVSKHVKVGQWSRVFRVVCDFDSSNEWISRYGGKYGADPIQLNHPPRVRLKHWMAAYDRFRVEEYGDTTVGESYGYLSEHAHPSGACFLDYREVCGTELRFVPAGREHLPDIGHSLLDWLMLVYRILALANEDTVRVPLLRVIETVAALRGQR